MHFHHSDYKRLAIDEPTERVRWYGDGYLYAAEVESESNTGANNSTSTNGQWPGKGTTHFHCRAFGPQSIILESFNIPSKRTNTEHTVLIDPIGII